VTAAALCLAGAVVVWRASLLAEVLLRRRFQVEDRQLPADEVAELRRRVESLETRLQLGARR